MAITKDKKKIIIGKVINRYFENNPNGLTDARIIINTRKITRRKIYLFLFEYSLY